MVKKKQSIKKPQAKHTKNIKKNSMKSTTTPSPMSTTPSSNETELLRSMELDNKPLENEHNDGQDTPPVQNSLPHQLISKKNSKMH